MGQPVPGWQMPENSFFKTDPNAPPPKRKGDEKESKETDEKGRVKIEEDEDDKPLKKKQTESPEDDVKEVRKNGIIDDSDNDSEERWS